MSKGKTKAKEIVVDVTPEEFAAELATGISEEQAVTPGRHVFRRGGFRERHPEFTNSASTERKVRISICLDADVLAYFKQEAQSPGALPYQTRINAILREAMTRESLDVKADLVADDAFIAAVADRVAAISRRP
jgi:uncharacterized protein (DUF4415 family)